ncbi:acyl-CoA dehydrogenase [Streptomyces armeniacus]|uniref:Acyl-CoA dehydrogenase n=1 Tax=Streptomyces armeniacus TaxID=83291 RepID=A0A345XLE6_9ACTN|nr:acyl-CoA dehydrogenase family protein [Streptomyces armeniacus]AXK32462.1 acyl-CoA dehydrogenase [Streptomyces armeniacus]
MAVDFTPDPATLELRERVRVFVRDEVVPAEQEMLPDTGTGPTDALRQRLQRAAKEHGLLAPTAPVRFGGLGLTLTAQAEILREAGHSLLGPLALNCAAPDEGNMHLMHRVATPEQQEKYLVPLVSGAVRSCFAMTEPSPGAGSDPSMLRTTARWDGDAWAIDGRKWYITGADGAAWTICMASTPEHGGAPAGATMFLVDAGNTGMRITRHIGSLDTGFTGGHCEVVFDDCRVSPDAVLGEVGRGFAYAQVRLAPARLTHCMRWLGIAQRAQDMALDRAGEREAFGQPLAGLGMVQQMLADSEIDLAACRHLIAHAAWLLDQGGRARSETAVAKTFVAEAVGRVVDRAVQVHGALGISYDVPLSLFLREVRPFRIYDGASEVHRMSIAKRAVRRRAAARSPQ